MDDRYARLVDAVCREAVANALRHGGRGRIGIRVTRDSCGDVAVTVSSPRHSSATAAPSGGHGIHLLRRHLTAHGGRLRTWTEGGRHLLGAWLPGAGPQATAVPSIPRAVAG